MDNMELAAGSKSKRRALAVSLAIIAAAAAWNGATAATLGQATRDGLTLVQDKAPQNAQQSVTPARSGSQSGTLSWNFGTGQGADGTGWTIERGRMTLEQGQALLQPDSIGRVALLSPPGLPDAARDAEEFVLGISGTGLLRVRVLGRRDARGGWITIADASGTAMHRGADGYTIKRTAGGRGAPIESLRIEITFRTTNPRPLTHISVIPAPR